jgi:integrase
VTKIIHILEWRIIIMSGFIRPRGKSFQVIIDVGKDVNGKRIRQVQTFKTKPEAEKALLDMKYNLANNNFVKPDTMTFGEFLKHWFDNYVKNRCEITTQQEYKRIIDKYVSPYLGDIALQKLQPLHIQQYYQYLMQEKKLSPNTVYRHHANIRKSLDYAMKQQFVLRNVADAVELPKKKNYESEYYSINNLLKLRELLKDHELEIPINLAIYLGLRRSEIAGLKWEHINLQERIVEIKESVVRLDKGNIVKSPKTKGSKRSIYIPDDLLSLLINHKNKQDEYRNLFGREYVNSNYVCTKINGQQFRPEKISAGFKKLIEHNNLQHIRLHDLRHTFATLLHQSGVPIKNISETLGHSDITTTLKIYTQFMDEHKKDVTMTMNNILKNKKEGD